MASVTILSRKVGCPTDLNWLQVKLIVRYLNTTESSKIVIGSQCVSDERFVDLVRAENSQDKNSNTGNLLFKLFGGVIAWASPKKALSSTEAKCGALSWACQDEVWLKVLLSDLNEPVLDLILIFEDNQSSFKIIDADYSSEEYRRQISLRP